MTKPTLSEALFAICRCVSKRGKNKCGQLWLAAIFFTFALSLSAQADKAMSKSEPYTIVELPTQTLPSLNLPRTGHATLCLNGELTVIGGHTDGFVPTATIEFLRDGAWHTVPMVYPHDQAIALELRSGKVLLAGGHKESLGIGHLFSAELYDPASHTVQGFGCMDKKRALGNAIEMADGQVVISGNWYADDGIEMFVNVYDPFKTNAIGVKDPTVARARPYILRVSDGDAIIFSSRGNDNKPIDPAIVDRLNGPSYREPFLETWSPMSTIEIRRSSNQFIGDEGEGRYEWLIPVENKETCEVAIARVRGGGDGGSAASFSLLPTQQSLPDSINGKPVVYSSLVCDRGRKIAYLICHDEDVRIFVVAIPYDTDAPAPLTVYVTAPQPINAGGSTHVLTPEGDLVFAGGHLINNFTPSNAVVLIPLGQERNKQDLSPAAEDGNIGWLPWIVGVCLLVCGALVFVAMRERTKASATTTFVPSETDVIENEEQEQNMPKDEALYARIKRLMEEEQLYLNANLRASDVAGRIGTNSSYISSAINSHCGCSFSKFLIKYRVSHAQALMRSNPDCKLSTISELSGFNSESTFFRVFRSATGMTPKEWLSSLPDK